MKTYKKNFVGKGTQVENLPIAKCTVKVAELLKFAHQYDGEDYVSFEVAKMKQPDQFGRDYTVYCTTTEEKAEETKPAPKSRKRKTETADSAF
jgi:hypothetical protein